MTWQVRLLRDAYTLAGVMTPCQVAGWLAGGVCVVVGLCGDGNTNVRQASTGMEGRCGKGIAGGGVARSDAFERDINQTVVGFLGCWLLVALRGWPVVQCEGMEEQTR